MTYAITWDDWHESLRSCNENEEDLLKSLRCMGCSIRDDDNEDGGIPSSPPHSISPREERGEGGVENSIGDVAEGKHQDCCPIRQFTNVGDVAQE